MTLRQVYSSISLLLCFILVCGGEETEAMSSRIQAVSVDTTKTLAIQIIEGALSDKNPRIRTKAIEVVSTCKTTSLMPKVLHLADDPIVPVRFSAVVAIGDSNYKRGIVTLKRLLEDKNKNIRIASAYSMVKLGNAEFIQVVRDAMRDVDSTVQANAVWFLGKLSDKSALPLLYAAKDNLDIDDKVRFQAVEAIAMIGDENIYPKIWTMLLSTYADDRVMGIKTMGALGSTKTSKASNALISMLDDDVPEVRLAAAEQLGLLGDKSGQVVVEGYFAKPPSERNKNEIERQDVFAALAIGRIGTKSLKAHLPVLLKSESKQVRLAAAKSALLLAK